MGKQRELTWHKARGVWKKKYQGNVYYLSKAGECKGPDDRRGYEKALLKWLQMKADIDGQGQGQRHQPRAHAIEPPNGGIAFASLYNGMSSLAPFRERKEYSLAEVIKDYLKER